VPSGPVGSRRRQGQREGAEGAEEARGGRFERGGGQRAGQVRLVKTHGAQARRLGVLAEPGQLKLGADGEDDESVGGRLPITDEVGIGHGEIERCMRGLTRLRPRSQIGPGHQIQAVRRKALTVRHARTIAKISPRCPHDLTARVWHEGGSEWR
jgi:hypothetical protein